MGRQNGMQEFSLLHSSSIAQQSIILLSLRTMYLIYTEFGDASCLQHYLLCLIHKAKHHMWCKKHQFQPQTAYLVSQRAVSFHRSIIIFRNRSWPPCVLFNMVLIKVYRSHSVEWSWRLHRVASLSVCPVTSWHPFVFNCQSTKKSL